MSTTHQRYYVPHDSGWPIFGAVALLLVGYGAASWVTQAGKPEGGNGVYIFWAGIALLVVMLFGWFGTVIRESTSGLYSDQLDRSFRQCMAWFIFSEVMFFLAFFGALFYARVIAVPWLGGAGNNAMTGELLWPQFDAVWPVLKTPGGTETQPMPWSGIPLINTLILLASSVTLQVAHTAIELGNRARLKIFLGLTIVLGAVFLGFQVYEYVHAYRDLGLRLDSGIYGNTFFLLTGFHGLHVTIGAILLLVIWLRIVIKDHFTADKHFGFQAAAWYWHFVDVVWLNLFIFVYVL
ncbi:MULTISPECIES: cytochrome c oxidase subunit 3 [unclassified Thauera]|uniref:cytochrome c oxidase subunit 3 n=1 Tax=unclassified Thauera TaxID=2609274 RepID=UPI0002D02A9A|nr:MULTISPECIES: cytochrome c oxidase subunit 3 [unclassified Thauera]ENO79640.1 cytochrome-c oxidase [Thauera sp. 27]WBL65088.1 cytochrome c oxidase subunit 3 [Thauera sp. WB-2]HAG76178.1 cytochrome c oxidase subunit 3 [Thauera sp.]HNR60390.1 cytochrome c oxidase subunit 3 [Thauera sp.]HRJ23055.1 cytochrome c oxidase subunit 3 [Thauera sp.]